MAHVTLTLPKKHSTKVEIVRSKITSWYCVTKVTATKTTITWDQDNFYDTGAESLASFIEGLIVAFLPAEVTYTVEH